MTQISAKIIKDSITQRGHRVTTILCVFPRFILAELNTHRAFSRNSASSRAIPFKRMVKMVEEDPFIPIAWQKDHKGMQGTEYLTGEEAQIAELRWLQGKVDAINRAKMLNLAGVTKQIANRLLEPFMWHTALVTATEWDNFFELRCPKYALNTEPGIFYKSRKDLEKARPLQYELHEWEWWQLSKSGAEIHIQALAEAMWDAMNESIPSILLPGQWHIPFDVENPESFSLQERIMMSTARAARTSFTIIEEGRVLTPSDLYNIYSKLSSSKPKHSSPFEHCNMAMYEDRESIYDYHNFYMGNMGSIISTTNIRQQQEKERRFGWCYNMHGFIPLRYLVDHSIPLSHFEPC